MRKEFYVVLDDSAVKRYRMKQWLRDHPDQLPDDCDATSSTSHQLRNALKKQGWAVHDTETEVLLTPPGVMLKLPPPVNGRDDDLLPAEFTLEYQLRDFLVQNLEAISVEGKKLSLHVDPAGREGVEFPTDVGPIDILAVDETGAFVVFELKLAPQSRSGDWAIVTVHGVGKADHRQGPTSTRSNRGQNHQQEPALCSHGHSEHQPFRVRSSVHVKCGDRHVRRRTNDLCTQGRRRPGLISTLSDQCCFWVHNGCALNRLIHARRKQP